MAAVHYVAFLAIMLFLQSHIAHSDAPVLPSYYGEDCRRGNFCGKGACVPYANSPFGFECLCEPGWKQARSSDDNYLRFLPCLIPNCTIEYRCSNAPPGFPFIAPPQPGFPFIAPPPPGFPFVEPPPTGFPFLAPPPPVFPFLTPAEPGVFPFFAPPPPAANLFNPCAFTNCGGGICRTTSQFTRICLCQPGYYNLYNSTSFPCYSECAFGVGCPSLGLRTSTSLPNPNHSLNDNYRSNKAAIMAPGAQFACLIAMAIALFQVVLVYT